jgi:hypothetical protein
LRRIRIAPRLGHHLHSDLDGVVAELLYALHLQGLENERREFRIGQQLQTLVKDVILLAADFGWSVVKALIAHKLRDSGSADASGHATSMDQRQARLRTLLPIVQNMLFAIIAVVAVLMAL